MPKYYEAQQVREYTDSNGEVRKSWTKVGVAFPFKSGKGFNVKLESLPLTGEFMLIPPKPKDGDGSGDDRQQNLGDEGGGERDPW